MITANGIAEPGERRNVKKIDSIFGERKFMIGGSSIPPIDVMEKILKSCKGAYCYGT